MRRPKIGISLQVFWDYIELNLDYALNHAVNELGFECVEIHCQNPMYAGWGTPKAEDTTEKIKDILSTLDTETSIHGPYMDINLASWNKGIAEESVKQMRQAIHVASQIGSGIVVAHPGYMLGRKYSKEKTLKRLVNNFSHLSKYAEDYGVILCMENLAHTSKAIGVHVHEIITILDWVGSDHFRLCLDAAHINTTGLNPGEFAEKLRGYVKHVHLSDNMGSNEHLPIGIGDIDFREFLHALKPYSDVLIIEGWIPQNQDPFLRWDKKKLEEAIEGAYGRRRRL